MVVLSARFTLLASLCALAAVAIPPRAEAAHIYAGHSMEKHISSPHRRTPGAFHGSTHRHDEKTDVHPDSQEHHSPGLPPLLRRHIVSDHKQGTYDHHDQGHHDHASHKTSPSVFARSRYRQGPTAQYRRSSVFVPGEQGNMYLVSGSRPKDGGDEHSDTGNLKLRRQVDESDLALGRIDIMGASGSAPGTQRLASLTVNSTPIDWTSGQATAKAFPLNASTTNQTQFIMMPLQSDGTEGFDKHVTLATEVFDASNAVMVMYCATYDSDPGATSALLMTPCTTQSVQVNDAGDACARQNDATSLHESQVFSYDPSTGKIEPMSIVATSSDTSSDDDDDSGSCVVARSVRRRDNASSTTGSSTKPSLSSTSAAPSASALQQARNVTLIYVAGELEVPVSSSSSVSSNSVSASASRAPVPAPASAAVVTTTLITTVLATATASGSGSSSSRSISPAQAAVSASIPSQLPLSSVTTIIPKPPVSGTPTHENPVNPTSTVPKPPASTKAQALNADESFEVDIVGIAPSTTPGASLSASATASRSSTSATLDPLAVASSAAKPAVPRRDASAVMSASVV